MGVGKTTIGRLLAKELGRPFFDSDVEVEKKTGASINWIFDLEGEAGFRRRECSMLKNLLAMENIVLATGGGSVLSHENRAILTTLSFVIYLRADLAQQLRRTRWSKNRPLLQEQDPEETLKRLTAEREPWYRQISQMEVDTNVGSPSVVVNEILEQIKHANRNGRSRSE